MQLLLGCALGPINCMWGGVVCEEDEWRGIWVDVGVTYIFSEKVSDNKEPI